MPPIVKRPVIGRTMVQKRLRRQGSRSDSGRESRIPPSFLQGAGHPEKLSNNNR